MKNKIVRSGNYQIGRRYAFDYVTKGQDVLKKEFSGKGDYFPTRLIRFDYPYLKALIHKDKWPLVKQMIND